MSKTATTAVTVVLTAADVAGLLHEFEALFEVADAERQINAYFPQLSNLARLQAELYRARAKKTK